MACKEKENSKVHLHSEVTQNSSVFLKLQTRPKINKHKVGDFIHKTWEISSSNFGEKHLFKNKLFTPSKDSRLKAQKYDIALHTVESSSNEAFKRPAISVKRKSISEKIINGFTCIDENNSENSSTNVFKKSFKSVKRKSMTETTNITNDFTYFNEKLIPCNVKSVKCIFRSNGDKLSISSKAKNHFNINDIEAAFEYQTRSSCIKPTLTSTINSVGKHNLQNTELSKCDSLEKLHKNSKSIIDNFCDFNKPSLSNSVTKVPIKRKSNMIDFGNINLPVMKESFINLSTCFLEQEKDEIKWESPQKESYDLACQNTLDTLNLKKSLFENESVGHGSNWMQSLQWSSDDDQSITDGKKKIRNLLLGGYAEQLLKLQRRELFEKAIYEHKFGAKKSIDSVTMTILSTFPIDEVVVTKCVVSSTYFSNKDNKAEILSELNENNLNLCTSTDLDEHYKKTSHPIVTSHCFVLFQKNIFLKQQMKNGFSFLLLEPWHYLEPKSLQCPVIFCTSFKNISGAISENDMQVKENQAVHNESSTCFLTTNCISDTKENSLNIYELNKSLYFKWNANINLDVRIQRIWEICNNLEGNCDTYLHQRCNRSLFLLQSRSGIFFELIVPLLCSSNWLECILNGEGKTFHFFNLKIINRLQYKQRPNFFRYLQNLLNQSTTEMKLNQDFIYQLIIDNNSKFPCGIIESCLPHYLMINYQPLDILLQKGLNGSNRFSCVVNVLFSYKNVVYITDESIFYSENTKYIEVKLLNEGHFSAGSQVIIKEALVQEGCLQLDEYSKLSIVPAKKIQLKKFTIWNLQVPLRVNSKKSDLVFVEGAIINVDENEAYTWLQCNFCLKENLVQDSNGTIYCEDCSSVVNKPLLNVKLSVTIVSEKLPNILLSIQLLSQTVKTMLLIDENSCQPQCSVSDVLGKKIGPMLCYVRGNEIIKHQKQFYLTELNPP